MKVVIVGYGLEGKVSFEYWHALGADVSIADERDSLSVPTDASSAILGSDAFSRLSEYDVIIRSPGINPKKLPYGDKVWSATNEFFDKCPAEIIGVTGTKGKGTTSSLIAAILTASGRNVHLLGNIGVPALEILPSIAADDIVVYELSSFQLWDVKKSPHVAVVLGIEPDHLDTHDDFDDYVRAKANITAFQSSDDVLVYNAMNEHACDIAMLSCARKIEYPIAIDEYLDSIKIPGAHNVENTSAAIAAASEYVTDPTVIKQGVSGFEGLPHRIKFIRTVNNVSYYDDNYSSAPSATMAAVRSFEDAQKVLIAGGYDKGIDLSHLASELSQQPNLAHIILIGQTGPRIKELLTQHGYEAVTLLSDKPDMATIIDAAVEKAPADSVILMSPGCASFDMFANFSDRGDQFVRAVEAL